MTYFEPKWRKAPRRLEVTVHTEVVVADDSEIARAAARDPAVLAELARAADIMAAALTYRVQLALEQRASIH